MKSQIKNLSKAKKSCSRAESAKRFVGAFSCASIRLPNKLNKIIPLLMRGMYKLLVALAKTSPPHAFNNMAPLWSWRMNLQPTHWRHHEVARLLQFTRKSSAHWFGEKKKKERKKHYFLSPHFHMNYYYCNDFNIQKIWTFS